MYLENSKPSSKIVFAVETTNEALSSTVVESGCKSVTVSETYRNTLSIGRYRGEIKVWSKTVNSCRRNAV